MGGVGSTQLNALPPINPDSFALYLFFTGLIELVNVQADVLQLVSSVCTQSGHTFRVSQRSATNYTLTFNSSPFYKASSAETSMQTKRMMLGIHSELQKAGWFLVNAPILVMVRGLSSWIFARSETGPPPQVDSTGNNFAAINISSFDKLQFIDFPSSLITILCQLVESQWYKGVSEQKQHLNGHELKLNGYPWSCTGEESLRARDLLLSLVNMMDKNGYKFVNSTALKQDTCDCMFFHRTIQQYPSDGPQSYFLMSLKSNDYVVFVGTDAVTTGQLNNSFTQQATAFGIKEVGNTEGFPSVKFNGAPWSAMGEAELDVKLMFCLVMQDLGVYGWHPRESIDCSRRIMDKSNLLFHRVAPARLHYFALIPSRAHRLYIVNAPPDVLTLIRTQLAANYTPGIKTERNFGVGWKIKFEFSPIWGHDRGASVCYQYALLACLSALRAVGWNVMCSADLSNRYVPGNKNRKAYSLSAQTLFIAKIVG